MAGARLSGLKPATVAQQRVLLDLVGDKHEADCAPIVLEVLGGAPDGETYSRDWDFVFSALDWLPLDDRASRRAVDVQRALAGKTRGAHRRPALDYLIAACAEAADDIILWHWDHDLRIICEHTRQLHEAEHARARRHRLAQPD